MYSVTQRIKTVKQPYGGYIKVKDMEKTLLEDSNELYPEENINASLVGLAVDYLTRFMMGSSAANAFEISYLGAERIRKGRVAQKLIGNVKGLDNKSIISACKLTGFDVCFRASISGYKPIEDINPDAKTIHNIKVMVERSLKFWKQYGPVLVDGFTFEGGYTATVSSGDGDYLTRDTLWDFKVSKNEPTSKHTLQILMYYILGKHSIHPYFDQIQYLGIYNPRLNKVYRYNINNISLEVIEEVSNDVIGYGKSGIQIEATKSKVEGLSIKETAKVLGISGNKVRKLVKNGELVAKKKGNKYVIKKSDIQKYRRKRQRQRGITALLCLIFLLLMILYFSIKYIYV